MKRAALRVAGALGIICSTFAGVAHAQGGGSTTAGVINGKVSDSSGGVLPGVTVTVKSPALIGLQMAVTDTGGNYRFPALAPGTYTAIYELTGFASLERTNIEVSIGFTTTLNIALSVATLQETVTVSGASPVIDAASTRVQQTYSLLKMSEIPNARDMWALIAVTPAVTMARTDVGGSQTGTQGNYRAYGFTGQRQVILEGINITYDTTLSQAYPDFGSFEEVSVETLSHGAAVAGPGTQTQMVTKSGGNQFHGELFQDYENNSMVAGNIPGSVIAQGIAKKSNETALLRDFSTSLGGPIKHDKVWWQFSYHKQKVSFEQPNFVGPLAGTLVDIDLYNYSGKGTWQLNQQNKLVGYVSRNTSEQPYYPVAANFFYTNLSQTTDRWNDVWVYKGEWNGSFGKNMFAEVVYGAAKLASLNVANTDTTAFYQVDAGRATYVNGERKRQYTPERRQIGGSMSFFNDGWGGSHNLKVGGGYQPELRDDGYTQYASGNVMENFNSGAPVSVVLYAPTATAIYKSHENDQLITQDRLNVAGAYANDQWSIGRATFNLGVRWDHYRAWSPDQIQLPYSFGPLNVPAANFPSQTYFTWNKVVPRLGLIYDLTGNGKTVVKLNYGLYGFDPGISLGGNGNPNQLIKSVTYAWTDNKACPGCIAGDGIYQPGEEGAQTANALAGNIQIDPNLKQPTSTQATVYLERQLPGNMGARVGYVYYTVNNQVAALQPLRPASAYTVPFNVADPGPDGVTGTADDKTLTFYGIPNNAVASYPNTSVLMNTPNNGQYKTFETSIDKRRSHNFSVGAGFAYTWLHDFPLSYPNTPNGPFDYNYRVYNFNSNGSYMLPHDFQLSAVYRFKAGDNYARTLSVRAPASCACTFSAARGGSLGNTTVYATPYDAYSQDNVSDIDLRLEKTIKPGRNTTLRVFVDGFNLTNSYAAETISVATGPSYLVPTAILAPRTGRIGARFTW